jgi:hypothetical protein
MAGKRQVRAAFRSAIFGRDRYRCAMCGSPGKDRQGGDGHAAYHAGVPDAALVPLDAHHITDRHDMPGGGYVAANGITLCDAGCHARAEAYHQTGTAHPGYAPADLYAAIGSSYEAARRDSAERA